ncbi:hypothetical protein PTKIN_Ptkin17bG0091800 [Pterospermum kingtungense]
MARHVIVLALLLIALVGFVSAAGNDAAPKTTEGGAGAAVAPANDDAIGNTNNDVGAPTAGNGDAGVAIASPISSQGATNSAAAQAPTSGATNLGVSTIAGAVAVAGYFIF